MGKVACSSLTNHKQIVILHLEDAVVALRQDKAVSLTIHGLGTQRASNKEHVAAIELLHAFWQLEHTNLDAGVLLGRDTLTTATIVISARLALGLGEDRVAFAKLDLVVILEVVELPPDELVVVRVLVRRDEAASPIGVDSKLLKVRHAEGWEEVEPVVWILELGDFRLGDIQFHQHFVLGQGRRFVVLGGFLQELFRWLITARLSACDLTLQADGCGGDRHACAVEPEWEKCALAELPLIAGHKLGLGHGVGVT